MAIGRARRSPVVRWLVYAAISLPVTWAAAIPRAVAALADVVERVRPSVVAVGTFQKTRNPAFFFRGTGFVVADGTLIATAAHAVTEALQVENREIMMVLVTVPGVPEPQGREATAVAVDKVHDIALLRIGGTPLPAVTFGNSS